MMALFWYHNLLYQYGLLALLLFGGLGITALITSVAWLTRPHGSFRRRRKSALQFPLEDVPKVVLGTISMVAVPTWDERPPRTGTVCSARGDGDSKGSFATLVVTDVRRRIVADLRYSHFEKMGLEEVGDFFQKTENAGFPMLPEDEVYTVEFEIVGGGGF